MIGMPAGKQKLQLGVSVLLYFLYYGGILSEFFISYIITFFCLLSVQFYVYQLTITQTVREIKKIKTRSCTA